MRCLAVILAFAILTLSVAEAGSRRGNTCDSDLAPRCSTNDYDFLIESAARRWMPPEFREQWCYQKAQWCIESNLLANAAAPNSSALGLTQVLDGTAKDIAKRLGIKGNRRNVQYSLEAGTAYLADRLKVWSPLRPRKCWLVLGQASYHDGGGGVIKGQVLSGGERCFEGIAPYMIQASPHTGAHTVKYVFRIQETYLHLRGLQ